jgi:hypothetical protein
MRAQWIIRRARAIRGTAVLQPDRRTIVVGYRFGGCSELASAGARRRGSLVTVSAVIGVEKHLGQTACPANLAYGATLVRLPEPAPAGTTVTVARCGRDGEPVC